MRFFEKGRGDVFFFFHRKNPADRFFFLQSLSNSQSPHKMQTQLKIKLALFMFLQYFIWAAWYVSMGAYLSQTLEFEGGQIGAAYGAFAIGAIISPFLVGLIADRYFAAQKILAFLGLVGGGVLVWLSQLKDFGSFYPVLILYCALYVPTLALGNSVALHHLADAKKDFPVVKLFSAVGWIAGLATLNFMDGALSPVQFYLAGGASVVFGLFALSLPHTPPMKTGADVSLSEILGLDALKLLRKPTFAIFILCMFLICIPLYFYFVNLAVFLTELKWTDMLLKTSLAQVSDIIFFLFLPFFLKRLGYKTTIFIGIACWVARYFLLSGSVDSGMQTALIFAAILLHGACYDFLFIAGQLYVDDEANEKIRSAAQGFIAFILWGVGAWVGTFLAGRTLEANKLATPTESGLAHNWEAIWQMPAYLAVGVLVVFVIFFKNPSSTKAGS
jgi:nucleoside transporter